MGSETELPPLKFIAKPLVPTELMAPPIWLIKGILPEGFLTLLRGLPGSFKTYLMVSMVCCLATGMPWLGRRTKKCNVLLIGADDPDGPRMRAQAWCNYHDVPFEAVASTLFDQPVNLHYDVEVDTAIENINRQGIKPDLVVWDTLFHTTIGADLTLPKDVLPIFVRARKLLKEIQAHSGFLVHHTPKDGRSTFGSVTIPASVDVIMDAEENVPGSTITLSNPRMRRARAFDPIEIRLAPIKVETLPDDEGVKFVANGAPAPAKATAKEKDLSNMEFVLEIVLGNRATNADWMVAMQQFAKGKKGWSQANFDKKLGELKKANRVTGGGAQGEYYSSPPIPQRLKPLGATVSPNPRMPPPSTTWRPQRRRRPAKTTLSKRTLNLIP